MSETLKELLEQQQFEKAEEQVIKCLEQNYLDSQLWVYLMEALCFQGYGEDALKVLERANLLEPHASWLEQAKKDIKEYDLSKTRTDIEQVLSMNVKNVTVSAAMIVRNEEDFIEECILSVIDAVDEFVIVDTGSTDNTINIINTIAYSYPKKIKLTHFEWCDDFSKARNAAIPHITSDWVLWIDADARLFQEDLTKVREVAGLFEDSTNPLLFKVMIFHESDNGELNLDFDEIKMFSMKFGFKYRGRIHEQPYIENSNLSVEMPLINLRFRHVGYKQSVMDKKKKAERNLILLEKTVEEYPEDPLWCFFYGRELYCEDRLEEAINVLLKAEALPINSKGLTMDIYLHIIKSYLQKSDYEGAEKYCLKAMKIYENFPDILYYYAFVQINKGYKLFDMAEAYLLRSKEEFSNALNPIAPHSSILNWKADFYLADIYKVKSDFVRSKEIYEKLKTTSPIGDEIQRILNGFL